MDIITLIMIFMERFFVIINMAKMTVTALVLNTRKNTSSERPVTATQIRWRGIVWDLLGITNQKVILRTDMCTDTQSDAHVVSVVFLRRIFDGLRPLRHYYDSRSDEKSLHQVIRRWLDVLERDDYLFLFRDVKSWEIYNVQIRSKWNCRTVCATSEWRHFVIRSSVGLQECRGTEAIKSYYYLRNVEVRQLDKSTSYERRINPQSSTSPNFRRPIL